MRLPPLLLAAAVCFDVAPAAAADSPAELRAQLRRAAEAEDKVSPVEIARRLLLAQPGDREALRIYAAGAPPAAVEALLAGMKGADAASVAFARGLAAEGAEDFPAAAAAYRAALAARPPLAPDDAKRARLGLAAAGQRIGRFEWVIEARRAAVVAARSPEDIAAARAALALALREGGDAEGAVAEIQAASRASAGDAEVKRYLPAFETLAKGMTTWKAIDAKARANPADLAARWERALAAASFGGWRLVLSDAEALVAADPEAAAPRLLKAHALRQLSREEDAVALRVAALPDPARFVSRLGPNLRAADVALRANPADATARARRAANLLAAGQPHLAAEEAARALKDQPNHPVATLLAAQSASQLGRRGEALALARRAAELDPKSADAWGFLAALQRKRAEYAAAAESFSRALALDARDADSLRARESALRTLGRDAEADRDRQALERLSPPR